MPEINLMAVDISSGQEQQPVTCTTSLNRYGSDIGEVRFNGVRGRVVSWSPNTIVATVPYGATTGELFITTARSATRYTYSTFTVLGGTWTPP